MEFSFTFFFALLVNNFCCVGYGLTQLLIIKLLMFSCYIRHLTNCTQNKIQLSRILTLLEERDSVKKVKTDVFNYLGWNFLKSLTINLGSIKSLWTKCEQFSKGGNKKEVLEPVVCV